MLAQSHPTPCAVDFPNPSLYPYPPEVWPCAEAAQNDVGVHRSLECTPALCSPVAKAVVGTQLGGVLGLGLLCCSSRGGRRTCAAGGATQGKLRQLQSINTQSLGSVYSPTRRLHGQGRETCLVLRHASARAARCSGCRQHTPCVGELILLHLRSAPVVAGLQGQAAGALLGPAAAAQPVRPRGDISRASRKARHPLVPSAARPYPLQCVHRHPVCHTGY
jgi:hypothetical protein